jgi:O-antigen/teichoic acid export membrane protein
MANLFGRNWMAARVILPYAGLAVAFASFANAAVSGLRAMRAASENLRLSVVMVPFLFIFCLGGAEIYGTRGAAGGLALAGAIYSVLSWSLLVKLARTFVPGTSAVVEDVVAEVSEP